MGSNKKARLVLSVLFILLLVTATGVIIFWTSGFTLKFRSAGGKDKAATCTIKCERLDARKMEKRATTAFVTAIRYPTHSAKFSHGLLDFCTMPKGRKRSFVAWVPSVEFNPLAPKPLRSMGMRPRLRQDLGPVYNVV